MNSEIGKIDRIGNSNLHIGDQWAAANIEELKKYNITHILCIKTIFRMTNHTIS